MCSLLCFWSYRVSIKDKPLKGRDGTMIQWQSVSIRWMIYYPHPTVVYRDKDYDDNDEKASSCLFDFLTFSLMAVSPYPKNWNTNLK